MVCTIEMPNADAEALLRFLRAVDIGSQNGDDPYERSRLETALEALTEAIEAGVNDE